MIVIGLIMMILGLYLTFSMALRGGSLQAAETGEAICVIGFFVLIIGGIWKFVARE